MKNKEFDNLDIRSAITKKIASPMMDNRTDDLIDISLLLGDFGKKNNIISYDKFIEKEIRSASSGKYTLAHFPINGKLFRVGVIDNTTGPGVSWTIIPARMITIDKVEGNVSGKISNKNYIIIWFDNGYDSEIDYTKCTKAYIGFSKIDLYKELNPDDSVYEYASEDVEQYNLKTSENIVSKTSIVSFIKENVTKIDFESNIVEMTADDDVYHVPTEEIPTVASKIALPNELEPLSYDPLDWSNVRVAFFDMTDINVMEDIYLYAWTIKTNTV